MFRIFTAVMLGIALIATPTFAAKAAHPGDGPPVGPAPGPPPVVAPQPNVEPVQAPPAPYWNGNQWISPIWNGYVWVYPRCDTIPVVNITHCYY